MSNEERKVDIFLIAMAKLRELYKNSVITLAKKQQQKKNLVMPADRYPVGLWVVLNLPQAHSSTNDVTSDRFKLLYTHAWHTQ